MIRLPPQPWVGTEGGRRILAALAAEEGETRLVGGAVRDALIGLNATDVDLATRFEPDEVVRRLREAGLKAVPTGIEHGTVTAVAPELVVEVTTLRRDIATDGRRAVVAYTREWREDAARRDFTINALYADPLDGTVYDYFGGIEDLDSGHIRFIGEPLRRIAEDHLRILRFFRFHARFGRGKLDPEGLAACAERANDLLALSRERIRDELLKLMAVADPTPTVTTMFEHGILAPVLPEVGPEGIAALRRLVDVERRVGVSPAALRRLAAALPADPELLDRVAVRLRLSNAERRHLVALGARLAAVPADPRPIAYWDGVEVARDRLLLAAAPERPEEVARALDLLEGWRRPRLPVSGDDLLALGIAPGRELGRLLRELEQRWAADGFGADRGELLAFARELRRG